MPAQKTSVQGNVLAVSDERRSFKVMVQQPTGLGEVWFRLSSRRTTTPLPTVGTIISFDAYGPEQNTIYNFSTVGQPTATLRPANDPAVQAVVRAEAPKETPETPPMGYTGLRSSRATVQEPAEPTDVRMPRYWKTLRLVANSDETGLPRLLDGHFEIVGPPAWGVIDRKTGNVYPLTSIVALEGAVK